MCEFNGRQVYQNWILQTKDEWLSEISHSQELDKTKQKTIILTIMTNITRVPREKNDSRNTN